MTFEQFTATLEIKGKGGKRRGMTFLIMEIAWALLLEDGTIAWDSYRVFLPPKLYEFTKRVDVQQGDDIRRVPLYNRIDIAGANLNYFKLTHLPWDPRSP